MFRACKYHIATEYMLLIRQHMFCFRKGLVPHNEVNGCLG